MAMQLGEAFVILRGDDTRLRSDLSRARGDTEKTAKSMEAAAKRVRDAWGAVGRSLTLYVTTPIMLAAAYSTRAMMEQEDATMSLGAALARTGQATEANMKRFEDLSTAIQKTTVYADELVQAGMGQMLNIGVPVDKLEQATKAAIGLAATYKIELRTAFMLVGRAAVGQTQTLARYGIVLDQAGDKVQKFNQVLSMGMSGFRLAEAAARTTGGRFQVLKNAIGDAAEKLGAVFLPVFVGVMGVVRPLVDFFDKLPPSLKAFSVVALMAAASVGPLISMLVKLAEAYAVLTKAEVAAAIAAIYTWAKGNPAVVASAVAGLLATITGVTYAITRNIGKAQDNFKGYIAEINKQIGSIKQIGLPGLPGLDEDAQKGMTDAALAAKKILDDENNAYREQAQQIWDIYTGLKASREEEEKRQRAAIGWTGLADLWRGAAVAGAQARFAEVYKPERMGTPGTRNELQIEARLMQRAVQDWQATQENTKATKNAMEMLVDLVRRIAPAFEAQVI